MSSRLSDIEIQRLLNARPGWARRGESLTKAFEFPSFPETIAFVNRVADVAERMDHHPDLDIRYTKVSCQLATHSAGGITTRDFTLAEAIDDVAGNRD